MIHNPGVILDAADVPSIDLGRGRQILLGWFLPSKLSVTWNA
jgi:hypothetical protein